MELPELLRHPWPPYIPPGSTMLLLGSFPPLSLVEHRAEGPNDLPFYYGSARNQMWEIWSRLTGTCLRMKDEQGRLDKAASLSRIRSVLQAAGVGVADIILICRRSQADSADGSLIPLEYQPLPDWLQEHPGLKTVLFTSYFVERQFRRAYPDLESTVRTGRLPSSSPRARGSLEFKTGCYTRALGISAANGIFQPDRL